ncbi:MAG: glycosyltransferase family 4 protein [Paracoccaceae bacterium]|nr:glycosyltransferase family 4 protein [Paracoccaceae bacterium]
MSPLAPPRVWLLTETYAPIIGGGETQARTVAMGLSRTGIPVTVVTRRSEAGLAPRETLDGVPVRRLGPSGRGHLKKWRMVPGLFFTLLLSRREFTHLLVCGYRVLGIPAVAAGRLLGKPVILKADNNGEMSGAYFVEGARKLGLGGLPRLVGGFVGLRNALLRRADLFVSLSRQISEEFRAGGVPEEKIRLIPNSVDVDRFASADAGERLALRTALGLPADAVIVVFTGRLLRSKGVLELTEAFAALTPDFPKAHLVIVGSGAGLMHNVEDDLARAVERAGLGASVTRTGFVTNVADYLRAADIFAFPTMEEAFGISLIEAMATGLASVAAEVGGIPDIVEDGVDGLLIPPADAVAIETALRRLLGEPALRARLGAAAAATVRARYTTPSVVARYAALLGEV